MKRNQFVLALFILLALILAGAADSFAQVNSATLSGVITDPQGLSVKSAKVSLVNKATGAERFIVADDSGSYAFIGVPPGAYELTVDAGTSFNTLKAENLVVTVGEVVTYSPKLEIRRVGETVTVESNPATVEITKSEVSQTVGRRQIEVTPIDGNKYIQFSLLNSQFHPDNAPIQVPRRPPA